MLQDVNSLASFLDLESGPVQAALTGLDLPASGQLVVDVQTARELIGDMALALTYLRSCCQREAPRFWADQYEYSLRDQDRSIGFSSGLEQSASFWSVFIKIDYEIVFNRPFDEIPDRVELHDTLVDWCSEGTLLPGVVLSEGIRRSWEAARVMIEKTRSEKLS